MPMNDSYKIDPKRTWFTRAKICDITLFNKYKDIFPGSLLAFLSIMKEAGHEYSQRRFFISPLQGEDTQGLLSPG